VKKNSKVFKDYFQLYIMKKYIIIAVILIVIIVVGIFLFAYRNDLRCFSAQDKPLCKAKIYCSFEKAPENQDLCFMRYATQFSNLKICDEAKNGYTQSNCYKAIALSTQDSYTCSIIPIEKSEASIKRDCYIELATIKKDVSLCQSISTTEMNQRDYCKVLVAVATKDASICQNLESGEYISKAICVKRANAGSNDIME
jgi:hypothetical protein